MSEVNVRETRVSVVIRREQPLSVGDVLRTESGALAVVGAIVDDLAGGDIAWPGRGGSQRVEKIDTASDVLEARSIGPYSMVTEQPLAGKPAFGGQRVGTRALHGLLNRGACVTAHEMVTVKSNDVPGRHDLFETLVTGRPVCVADVSATAETLRVEISALGFEADVREEHPTIRLLTTAAIRRLAPHVVTRPDTIRYRTSLPIPGGLFCTEVFGDLGSHDRRLRMGRVELPIPLIPPWSRDAVALLLGIRAAALVPWTAEDGPRFSFEPETVAPGETLRDALRALDLDALYRADDRRGDLARDLRAGGLVPADLLVDAWLILPPDLRKILRISNGRFATSDVNDLYARLVNHANRLKRLLEFHSPEPIIRNESLHLQQALDKLVQNGAPGGPEVRGPDDRRLGSLDELLWTPPGCFAVLKEGKCVDYAGRARVVVRDLPPDCAFLPRELAIEIWRPWIYHELELEGHVTTVKQARRFVDQRHTSALEALERIASYHPLLLFPGEDSDAALSVDVELWDEPAVALGPSAIDALHIAVGATVAVHVPIDPRAIEEARSLLRGEVELAHESVDDGWLSRASRARRESLGATLFEAALRQEADPANSRTARLILGRCPVRGAPLP